jgi:three-Cys-motif partner protein
MAKRKWHGDRWTQEKLEKLALYAAAFQQDMQNSPFKTKWIDACSGTGFVERWKPRKRIREGFFPDPPNISEGSARRALGLDLPFDRYVLVEKNRARFQELRSVLGDFPHLADRITLRRLDANNYLPLLCRKTDWNAWRAVVFLDPPGAQIQWETVKAIADTKAADLWYLFPLGQTVNRFLRRNWAKIEDWQRQALDDMFGATDWYDRFYRTIDLGGFEPRRKTIKLAGTKEIIDYFVERLKTVFQYVVEWPYRLYNRTGIPLFTLCFASPIRRRAEMGKEILRRPSGLLLGSAS